MRKIGVVSWGFLQKAALLYFALPAFIFLLFWFRAPWNILFVLLSGYAIWKSFWKGNTPKKDEFSYSRKENIWLAAFILLLCFVMGMGGWMPQEDDYEKTNAFFNGLKSMHWPWGTQYTDGKTFSVVYYFGYIMLPAIGGALFGSCGIAVVSFLVGTFGLWLGLMAFGKYFKLSIWALLVFLGLNGLSFVGSLLQSEGFTFHQFYGLWSWPLVNVSMLETLYCSPHHLITPLVLLPLVLRCLDEKRYDQALIWLSLGLYWSPLTTMGIAIFALWGARRATLKELVSFRNIVIVLGLVIPIAVFFSIRLYPDYLLALWKYPWVMRKVPAFLFLDLGVWLLFIRGKYWRDSRVWVAICAFVVLTFFTMGQWMDLLFRTGMPLRLFLFALVLKSLWETPRLSFRIPFAIIYMMGMVAPLTLVYFQFYDQNRPALSEYCTHEYRGFFLRLDHVLKQYYGDVNKSAISKALLRPLSRPDRLPDSSANMELYSYVLGARQDFDEKGSPYYIYKGVNQFTSFWVNHDDPHRVYLTFDIENKTGHPMKMELVKQKDVDRDGYWHYYTALECLEGKFVAKASGGEPSQRSRITIPSKGCHITATTRLLSGVTEFALVRDPREEKNIQASDETYILRNLSVRIIPEGILAPDHLYLEPHQ